MAVYDTPKPKVRHVSAVTYEWPAGIPAVHVTMERSKLLLGKMLMTDGNHPLPADLPPPNTASIAIYGNGNVPVRSLKLKTGRETIDALSRLFSQLHRLNVSGLYVWKGAATREEQRSDRLLNLRRAMTGHSVSEAVQAVKQGTEEPGTGSLLQEYTVELRFAESAMQMDEKPFEAFSAGQILLQQCWRYGFVRVENPYRFRYVGKAHATAMTYLDLSFEDYLVWLRQKGTLVISSGGHPQYLILCKQMEGDCAAFDLPAGASWEASLDNTGYAVVACTL